MLNFSEQCMDMARAILSRNLESINEDGSVSPLENEVASRDEPGHVAFALGEFYRATGETSLQGYDIVDLAARALSNQTFSDSDAENGIGYSALGLLSFGPAKDRNPVWEKLNDETRKALDKQLLERTDYEDHYQVFNIAKAVARFSMGLSKKDETGKLIDRFLERISQTSSANYFDDHISDRLTGAFDITGIFSFVFIRQALQLHANMHLRDRKIPSLRTYAEKYLKLLPDIVRDDGLGWSFGHGLGVYSQMYCISMILQAMRDGWILEDKMPEYMGLLRKLFQFFFMSFLNQEEGSILVKDFERTGDTYSTRMANFDAARYLCQWARLAKCVARPLQVQQTSSKTYGKYISFDSSQKKEQGVFIYRNAQNGLHLHLPLIAPRGNSALSLAFPHMPNIFDCPADKYLPILTPELTINGKKFVPSFYGKRCTTGIGLRQSYFFRYEQPELITSEGEIVAGVGSCKVNWTFGADKITADYIFSVKQPTQLDSMRFVVAIAVPHSQYHVPTTCVIGENGLGIAVEKDDFQAEWLDTQVVSDDENYRTFWGKIHYLQVLERSHKMNMRAGIQYRLTVSFAPDIVFTDM